MVEKNLFFSDPGPSYQIVKSHLGHVSFKDSLMNHSRIVGTYSVVKHSSIVEKESLLDRHDSNKIVCRVNGCISNKTIGIFHSYPVGICNPAFTGMFLWELDSNHQLNDYKISQYHLIKSGIILNGPEA